MKKIWIVFFMLCLSTTLFAAEQEKPTRSVLGTMAYLEGRGLANAFLFPAEWGHLPKAEYGGVAGYPFVLLTHLGGRLFSGLTDIVFLPIAYPFTRYDESLPVNMGWGEYPWDKPTI